MRISVLPVIIVAVISTQGCWDTTIFAVEKLGGTSATDTETSIFTDSYMPPDSETLPDTERSTDADADTDTDTTLRLDTESTECETTYNNALVCTGFEGGISLDTHNISADGGTLEIVTTPAYKGKAALHASTVGDRDYANVSGVFDPLFTNAVYFRAYYFIPAGEITGAVKLAAFEGFDPTLDGDELNVDFMVGQAGNFYVYLHEPQQSPTGLISRNGLMPTDKWFCLRGGVEISDTAGSVVLAIGREEAVNAANLDTLSANGISWADFGVGWTDGVTNSVDVYIDDIVVDTSPIPCN